MKYIAPIDIKLYADDNILYFNKDVEDVIFSCNEMGILSIDLNTIKLDNTNYNEDEPETIIHVIVNLENVKHLKKG